MTEVVVNLSDSFLPPASMCVFVNLSDQSVLSSTSRFIIFFQRNKEKSSHNSKKR